MPERRVKRSAPMAYNRPVARRRPGRSARAQIITRIPWRPLVVGGGGVLVVWLLWSAFNVHNLNITPKQSTNNVKQFLDPLVQAGIRQGNLLTVNTDALASDLMAADPQLKSVQIRRSWPSSLNVTVAQKQPALGWSTGNQKYLLDRDGTVIGALPVNARVPVVVDGSNLPVQVGQRVVTARFVTFAQAVVAGLPATGLTPVELRVTDTTFDLYVQTNRPYKLLFDTSRPAEDQLSDLRRVQANLVQLKKTPSEYIDMRISGKAYYK